MVATIVEILLATAALAYVLRPLLSKQWRFRPRALPADRGPNDAELEAMIAAYRRDRVECPSCGLRPEPNATFCSECGRALPAASALDRVQASEGDADRDQRRE